MNKLIINYPVFVPKKGTWPEPDEWPWMPQWLTCTEKQRKRIHWWHRLFYGKNWYVVDPLGCDQIDLIMLEGLPLYRFWGKFVTEMKRVTKEFDCGHGWLELEKDNQQKSRI